MGCPDSKKAQGHFDSATDGDLDIAYLFFLLISSGDINEQLII